MPAPAPPPQSRFLRLHAFEILIFVIMAVLFALCLAAAPFVVRGGDPPAAAAAGP